MITQETAARIWECYREIDTSKKLLDKIEEDIKNHKVDPYAQKVKDCFRGRQDFQLGVPSGETGHSLYNVPANLAKSIIVAHCAAKNAELIEANEQARVELAQSDKVWQKMGK